MFDADCDIFKWFFWIETLELRGQHCIQVARVSIWRASNFFSRLLFCSHFQHFSSNLKCFKHFPTATASQEKVLVSLVYNFAYRAVSANRWKKAELVSVMAGISLVFVIQISHVRYSGQHASILNPDLAKYDISFTQINGKATRGKRHKVLPFRWKGQSKGKQKTSVNSKCFRRERQKLGKNFSRDLCIGKKVLSRTKSKPRTDLPQRENLD